MWKVWIKWITFLLSHKKCQVSFNFEATDKKIHSLNNWEHWQVVLWRWISTEGSLRLSLSEGTHPEAQTPQIPPPWCLQKRKQVMHLCTGCSNISLNTLYLSTTKAFAQTKKCTILFGVVFFSMLILMCLQYIRLVNLPYVVAYIFNVDYIILRLLQKIKTPRHKNKEALQLVGKLNI